MPDELPDSVEMEPLLLWLIAIGWWGGGEKEIRTKTEFAPTNQPGYLQIVPIHRRNDLQFETVLTVANELQDLLERVPFHVDAAQLHDKVALLNATELRERKGKGARIRKKQARTLRWRALRNSKLTSASELISTVDIMTGASPRILNPKLLMSPLPSSAPVPRTLRGAVQWRRAEKIAIGPSFRNGSSHRCMVKSGPVSEIVNLLVAFSVTSSWSRSGSSSADRCDREPTVPVRSSSSSSSSSAVRSCA
uniref:Ig-like domain-containing protein n=1 Tax=Anopheles melas TaxID=34690 RepID=A0A182UDA5_9DIPT